MFYSDNTYHYAFKEEKIISVFQYDSNKWM